MNELGRPFVRAWEWIEQVGGFPGQVFFVVAVIIVVPRATFGSVVVAVVAIVTVAPRSRPVIVFVVSFIVIASAAAPFAEPAAVASHLYPVHDEADENREADDNLNQSQRQHNRRVFYHVADRTNR